MLILAIKYLTVVLLLKLHPFHVSVCEVFYNTENESLEISLKLFIDDFESAVRQSGTEDFILSGIDQNEVLASYLKDRFVLTVDGQTVDREFVGYEFRGDAVLCYMLAGEVKPFEALQIENKVFTEVFDDQINLSHFEFENKIKSIRTDADNPSGTFTISD